MTKIPDSWWEAACKKVHVPLACVSARQDESHNKFLFVNQAWCRLLGYAPAEMLELTWPEVTDPEDVGGDMLAEQKLIDRKESEYYLEKRYIRKDQTKVFIGLFVASYPDQGDVECFVVTAREISSDSEQQIEALKRELTDELKAVVAKVNELANRNPLQQAADWGLKYWPYLGMLGMFLAWLLKTFILPKILGETGGGP